MSWNGKHKGLYQSNGKVNAKNAKNQITNKVIYKMQFC